MISRLLFISVCLLIVISCNTKKDSGTTGVDVAKEYYSDGTLKTETESVNAKANGLSKNYNKDGVLESVYTFKDGTRQGPALEYYPSGQLKQKMYYNDGKRDGITIWYYKSGKVFRETPYISGKTEGVVKSYYEDGKIMSEAPYLDGYPSADLKEYNKNGNLIKDDTRIVVKEMNSKPIQGKIMLELSLSESHPGTVFYSGSLTQGKYLNKDLSPIQTENGQARFAYFVASPEPVHFSAIYQTDNSSYRVITRIYRHKK